MWPASATAVTAASAILMRLQAVKTPPGRRYEERVMRYIELCDRIEEIDHKIMGTAVWQR